MTRSRGKRPESENKEMSLRRAGPIRGSRSTHGTVVDEKNAENGWPENTRGNKGGTGRIARSPGRQVRTLSSQSAEGLKISRKNGGIITGHAETEEFLQREEKRNRKCKTSRSGGQV